MQNLKAFMAAAALSSAGLVSAAGAADVAVDQKDLKFMPDAVTIRTGDSVLVADTDRIAHNVTIDKLDGTSEDKGMAEHNQHIVVKLDKPGSYQPLPDFTRRHMTITVK